MGGGRRPKERGTAEDKRDEKRMRKRVGGGRLGKKPGQTNRQEGTREERGREKRRHNTEKKVIKQQMSTH